MLWIQHMPSAAVAAPAALPAAAAGGARTRGLLHLVCKLHEVALGASARHAELAAAPEPAAVVGLQLRERARMGTQCWVGRKGA
jgi:hypothetical protein